MTGLVKFLREKGNDQDLLHVHLTHISPSKLKGKEANTQSGRKTTPQQQYFLSSITKQSETESRMDCCNEGNHIDREHIQHVTLRFDFKSVSTLRLYNYNYTSSN